MKVQRNKLFLSLIVVAIALSIQATSSQYRENDAESNSTTGDKLYKQNCQRCHGPNGTRGLFGAKNLQRSTLSDAAIRSQVKNGKGIMPSFKDDFSNDELELLVAYVKTLRK